MTKRFIVIFGSLKTEITRSSAVSIEDFIITVFCLIDDEFKKIGYGDKLRTRGFEPKLSDSEVICSFTSKKSEQETGGI